MSQLEKLQEINDKATLSSTINNVIFWVQRILQQSLQKYKNLFRDDANKILYWCQNKRLYLWDEMLERFQQNNVDEIHLVWKITGKWIQRHYLSHIFLYLLKISGIHIKWWKLYFDDSEKLDWADEYWFEYDLYLSYISWVKFHHNMFNIVFIENNNHILNDCFNTLVKKYSRQESSELLKIYTMNLSKFLSHNRKSEQKKMIELFRLADLLWVIEGEFGKEFYIDASMMEVVFFKEIWIYHTKPFFVQDIIAEIFWKNKTIKITEENYWEMKKKFQDTREKYLKDIWVEDIDDQKEIAQKLQQKYEQ